MRALLVAPFVLATLAGCAGPGGASRPGGFDRAHHALALAGAAGDGPGQLARALAAVSEPVRELPRSARGNRDGYTVFGRTYRVLDTSSGHAEEGVASWYGAKFHGRETSSGEPYDMHLLTAAHKSLPLPTFARVTRTDTGASVTVKINDRGPFVDDRIIDLSYAAAAQLDMLDSGTAPVRVEALTSGGAMPVGPAGPAGMPVPIAVPALVTAVLPVAVPAPAAPAVAITPDATAARWIQLGAFGSADNARALYDDAAGNVALPTRLEHDVARGLYRVRLGPFAGAAAIEHAAALLADAGFASYTLVSVAPPASVR